MKKVLAVILWALMFAYVESAVVEYLRALYYPLSEGGFQFPLLTLEQFEALGDEHLKRLHLELGRELATLAMLAAIGWAAGANFRETVAHFMIAFGVWDIFYYVWLKLFLDWPPSIMTWDLLFMIPVPWVSPVAAPVIVSAVMISAGLVILWYESRGHVLSTTWSDWLVLTAGGVLVIVSFCWDWRNIMAGGRPSAFPWPLFFVGLLVSSAWFVRIVRRQVNSRSGSIL